ncbi:MAG: hypothetical protein AB8B50_16050 [Pirellulaceae bacterium]
MQSALGVDIGRFSTKVVWVQQAPNGQCDLAVAQFASFPTQQGSEAQASKQSDRRKRRKRRNPFQHAGSDQEESEIAWDNSQLSDLVQRVASSLTQEQKRSTKAYLTVSMSECDIRSICIPRETTNREAAISPLLQESIGDSEPRSLALIPGIDPEAGKARVFSMPESLSLGAAKLFEENGLKLQQIDGLPWCQARLSANASQDPTQISLVLDWGYLGPTLTVVKAGEIQYVRRLTSGALSQLAFQARRDLGMNALEAMRWIEYCATGDVDAKNPMVSETRSWISQCCRGLAKEIDSAIEYVSWRFKQESIDGLLLIGGGSNLEFSASQLKDRLSIPTESWSIHSGNQVIDASFATATSLAMLGVSS